MDERWRHWASEPPPLLGGPGWRRNGPPGQAVPSASPSRHPPTPLLMWLQGMEGLQLTFRRPKLGRGLHEHLALQLPRPPPLLQARPVCIQPGKHPSLFQPPPPSSSSSIQAWARATHLPKF
ncbi:hypothetical protein JDV02_003055 [Purpureocillium takamizusanense]|uniref:Uncharacterized protein n=1 Tax=Purpureocillium takamizusanense TaxID=2060973 RepID=A0A9Q8QC70_9HYPO|nr:uncharacterized protein JDV02_003055 [Purpureocillium takamizusanense]UNI16633.1 hypothetical protein JDV02_003055 [Purpureocillium takamizusanense]